MKQPQPTNIKVVVTGQTVENSDGFYVRSIDKDGNITETFTPHEIKSKPTLFYEIKENSLPGCSGNKVIVYESMWSSSVYDFTDIESVKKRYPNNLLIEKAKNETTNNNKTDISN